MRNGRRPGFGSLTNLTTCSIAPNSATPGSPFIKKNCWSSQRGAGRLLGAPSTQGQARRARFAVALCGVWDRSEFANVPCCPFMRAAKELHCLRQNQHVTRFVTPPKPPPNTRPGWARTCCFTATAPAHNTQADIPCAARKCMNQCLNGHEERDHCGDWHTLCGMHKDQLSRADQQQAGRWCWCCCLALCVKAWPQAATWCCCGCRGPQVNQHNAGTQRTHRAHTRMCSFTSARSYPCHHASKEAAAASESRRRCSTVIPPLLLPYCCCCPAGCGDGAGGSCRFAARPEVRQASYGAGRCCGSAHSLLLLLGVAAKAAPHQGGTGGLS